MKRRSRMHEVSAVVPTAAQAAWRRNCRRVLSTDICLFSIKLPLDREVRRHEQQMDHGFDAVPHLSVVWGHGISKVAIDVSGNPVPGCGSKLTGEEQGAERV